MSLRKFRVLMASVTDGITDMPEKARPLSVVYDAKTGLPSVAFLMRHEDWAVEFPEEARGLAAADAAKAAAEAKKVGVDSGK